MKKVYVLAVLLLLVVLVAACGGGGASSGGGAASAKPAATAAPSGNAASGEALFKQPTIGQNPGCGTCHSLDGSKLVGPSLQGIATRAGSSVQGQSAEQYIHTSIVDPNAHVVEDYTQGVMPSFKDALNDQQLNDLIAFLMTQK
jgi:mono/diheme cytochrome c family protein